MAELKITAANFENEVLRSDKPVLLDFYADWCGPCKMLSPILHELAEEKSGTLKVGKVKQLLRDEPALTVKDIAASVGYHNIQSFNRFFKKSEMVTPSEYREHSMPSTSSQTPEV